MTKYFPQSDIDGNAPVNAYLIVSIIEVFPDPFSPNKIVNGSLKLISCTCSECYDLTPWNFIFDI